MFELAEEKLHKGVKLRIGDGDLDRTEGLCHRYVRPDVRAWAR